MLQAQEKPYARQNPDIFNVLSLSMLESQGGADGQAQNDLVKAVDQLLNNLGPKFSKVSAELFTKSRLKSINFALPKLKTIRSG